MKASKEKTLRVGPQRVGVVCWGKLVLGTGGGLLQCGGISLPTRRIHNGGAGGLGCDDHIAEEPRQGNLGSFRKSLME